MLEKIELEATFYYLHEFQRKAMEETPELLFVLFSDGSIIGRGTGGKAETEPPVCDWTGRGPSRVLPLGVGAGFQVSKTVAAEQVTAKDACSSHVPFPPCTCSSPTRST